MKEFKASTVRGQQIIAMANRCVYHTLGEMFKSWSCAKQRAYNWCLEQFNEDPNAVQFGVGSANCFGFTAKWETLTGNDEHALRVETKDNSYLVWLER